MADSPALALYGDLLRRGAEEIRLTLDPEQMHSFSLYAQELLRWNRRMNLTSLQEEREIVVHHFLGSLAFVAAFNHESPLSLVDIGSGAGFPGIPIKIACPHLEVTLIEASRKKSSFLRHILILLRLSRIECLRIRAEDLTEDARYQGRFDLAVARAAGPRENLYRVAAPLLRTRGLLVLSGRAGERAPGSDYPSLAFKEEHWVRFLSLDLERRLLTWERTD